jgi:mono/diheme cytochrome c family protein
LEAPAGGLGRIYRIRNSSGKSEELKNLAALQGPDLVNLLTHPNAWQRERAQRILVEHKDARTIPLIAKLTTNGTTVTKIHAIWTLEGMGALKAEHLLAAIQSTDAKLQSSALWASTRLAHDELMKLEAVLLAASPSTGEVAPYFVRALGPLGTPAAFSRLAEWLRSQGKAPFVREALVSGLDHHENEFIDSQMKGSKDTKLLDLLAQGARDTNPATAIVSNLKGEEKASFDRGKALFHGEAACFGCHGADGAGMPNLGPPLDESEWVTGKPATLAKILLNGLTGPVKVGDETYKPAADMPGLSMNPAMTDQSLADIATYIRNEWSNRASPVPASVFKVQREVDKDRAGHAWTASELMKKE